MQKKTKRLFHRIVQNEHELYVFCKALLTPTESILTLALNTHFLLLTGYQYFKKVFNMVL